ncbi:MAG: MerR family transcriptional regulator [Chitinophagaceae bacterium]
MNKFSIRDIEMLSGIKAHTFRIWEQRHGLYFCKRKDSQHRFYDNEDLKAVLRIAYLYHRGYKISKIANLSRDEVVELASANIQTHNYDLSIRQLIEASIDYDQLRFEKIIQHAILRFGFDKSILRVFYPFMEKIGLLWVTEHLIPAQEHFSSCLIQQKIIVAIDMLVPPQLNREDTILIFAPEGEMHEIPLLIAQYHFKKNGIKTIYFGANTAIPELEYYNNHRKITHLYFHSITNFSNREPDEYIKCLLLKFPGVKIIVSGSALEKIQVDSSLVKIASTVEDLIPVFLSL